MLLFFIVFSLMTYVVRYVARVTDTSVILWTMKGFTSWICTTEASTHMMVLQNVSYTNHRFFLSIEIMCVFKHADSD
jgi:hypothetical protein